MGEYVPNLKYYRTVYIDDKEKFVAGRLKILFVNIDYPLWITFDHVKHTHEWRMLQDEELPDIEKRGIKGLKEAHFAIKNIEGFFEAKPIDENNTLFYYSTLVTTKIPIPQAIEAYISSLTLPNYLAATRQRVIDEAPLYRNKNVEPHSDKSEEKPE